MLGGNPEKSLIAINRYYPVTASFDAPGVNPTGMEMQRKIILIGVATVLALAITSALSPWWTLHRIRSSIESRDYSAFSSYVDYPSLHASFKNQLLANGSARQDSESILGTLSEGII
jgi:hypothetical protein